MLCWVFVAASGLSLVAASGAYSLVVVCGPLIVVASPFGSWALGVVMPGLSCPTACGIFLDQGISPCPLHWLVGS